jgi:hypothetical protein
MASSILGVLIISALLVIAVGLAAKATLGD